MADYYDSKYGMFSKAGDFAVDMIVELAKQGQWSWADTYRAMTQVADGNPEVGEIMDTAVREVIYDLVVPAHDQDFYI
jgi:hypothetical protein